MRRNSVGPESFRPCLDIPKHVQGIRFGASVGKNSFPDPIFGHQAAARNAFMRQVPFGALSALSFGPTDLLSSPGPRHHKHDARLRRDLAVAFMVITISGESAWKKGSYRQFAAGFRLRIRGNARLRLPGRRASRYNRRRATFGDWSLQSSMPATASAVHLPCAKHAIIWMANSAIKEPRATDLGSASQSESSAPQAPR